MNSQSITYRRITKEDIPSISTMRVKFLDEVWGYTDHPLSESLKNELIQYYTEKLHDNNFIMHIALDNRKIVSTGCLCIWQAPISYSSILQNGKRAYISNMYTIKSHRKKGIAQQLLINLKKEVEDLNIEYLHLHATKPGMTLYQKSGFKVYPEPELVFHL